MGGLRPLAGIPAIRLYNGFGKASVKERVSLQGFTAAHETYLGQIGE